MNTLEFLQGILGDEGYYCIVGLKSEEKTVQKFYPKLEDAVAVAEGLSEKGYDAYYALCTLEDAKSRKIPNAKQLRSLYVDLDCGEFKPYANQKDAYKALNSFCAEIGLPKPHMVNSGGGLHAYWPFTAPVDRKTWAPIANRLKSLCAEYDLYIDPSVTADPVRILRVPGTLNFKNEEPRPVAIARIGDGPFEIDDLRNVIGEELDLRSFKPRGEPDELTRSLIGNTTSRFKTILTKSLAGNGCQQIAYLYKEQHTGAIPEPIWRGGLSIARFCIDAKAAIRKISEKDPRYSVEGAENKVHGLKGGPYTCAKFESENPSLCKTCPLKGTIKSPIVLGREVQEATDEDNIVEDAPANVDQGHTQTYVIPKFPDPYFRGKEGGVFKRIVKEDDEIEVPIYQNDIYVIRRVRDPELGESIVVRLHLPKDGVRDFTVALAMATSKDELRKELSRQGVIVGRVDEMVQYFSRWVNYMQETKKSDIARRQFGWTNKEHKSFILGDKEISADGVDYNPPSSATMQLIPAFEPKGSFEVWKETINFYNRTGMELHQFMIGLSIGSIFTDFTPINAALLHVYSQDSGIGKTTSGYAGLSIWGDPVRLAMKESDTFNSKMLRTEILKNIVAFYDELTNMTAKDASDFLYQITSGTQKNRMATSVNQERVRGEPWNLAGISTGNASLIEKIQAYKVLPKGEGMRVLEVRARPVPGLNKADTDILSSKLLNNYGHAAIPLLQHVMDHIDAFKQMYKETQLKLDKKLGFGPADRFHSVLVADGIMGLLVGRSAGIIDFDVKAVVAWLVGVVSAVKEQSESIDISEEGVLTMYLCENWNNILRIKSTDDARTKSSDLEHLVIPDASPRASFVARYEYDIRILYLYPNTFRDWCSRKQINHESIIDSLKRGRTRAKIEKKRMGKGTRMSLPAVDVLAINCKDFMDQDREEEIARDATY